MVDLTDAMRRTLDGYTRRWPGTSDPDGMIIGLAREHGLERPQAVACYREWERETLAAYAEAGETGNE